MHIRCQYSSQLLQKRKDIVTKRVKVYRSKKKGEMESFSDDWDILSSVYKMLVKQNVLHTPVNEPIVRFEHPADLKVILYANP